ncbi:MAG: protein translocase subunit SecD [Alphaproteobacteria bacterium]
MRFSRWQILAICSVCVAGILLALPNVVGQNIARSLPFENQIHLGLDLKGGSYLLLKVDTDAADRQRLEGAINAVRRALRTADIQYINLRIQDAAIMFQLRDAGRIADVKKLLQPIAGNGVNADFGITASDAGEFAMKSAEASARNSANDTVERSIEIVRRRIDETGVSEPMIIRQGADRIAVQLPGLQDPDRIKRLLGTTAKLSFHLLNTDQPSTAVPPPGTEYLYGEDAQRRPNRYLVVKGIEVDGAHLRNATAAMNQQTNEWVVNFEFDSTGARQFAATTQEHVGQALAIVLDNKVISAPVIREPILGGQGQISGHFTAGDANDLAILLRGGALPAPLKIIEERTVGPNLGADAIRTGIYACAIGGSLVIVFMIFFYRLFGVFASIGLVLDIVLLIGALSFFQANLTLPGIVGILLTIGMSVDANILINERIREEARKGRTPLSAIQTGSSKAMATIIDANVTTLLKMLILFTLASGPVKGFAITITLGILTSMFTAIVLVRLIMSLWLRRARPKALLA